MAAIDPVKHWISSAREELRAARTMVKGRHWRHVVFLCHLAVEKAIKAAVQKRSGSLPPKVHDLLILLRKAGVQLPGDLTAFIGQLSGLSIPTRYPDDLRMSARMFDRAFAERCVQMTRKVLRWFEQAAR